MRDTKKDEENFQEWQWVLRAASQAPEKPRPSPAAIAAREKRGAEWMAFWRKYFNSGGK
ncbi:MAG: hypothetical protein PHX68_03085 [Alphaproteobacteria bacterium]|nr:hypothetical protein [Alphaproteobacteria bacterium]